MECALTELCPPRDMLQYSTTINQAFERLVMDHHVYASIYSVDRGLLLSAAILGMLTTYPQCNFSLEFPKILRQNYTCCNWLSVSGISKIKHCGILIIIPYWSTLCAEDLACKKLYLYSISLRTYSVAYVDWPFDFSVLRIYQ